MALVFTDERFWFYEPAPDPPNPTTLFWQARDDSIAVYSAEYEAPEE